MPGRNRNAQKRPGQSGRGVFVLVVPNYRGIDGPLCVKNGLFFGANLCSIAGKNKDGEQEGTFWASEQHLTRQMRVKTGVTISGVLSFFQSIIKVDFYPFIK